MWGPVSGWALIGSRLTFTHLDFVQTSQCSHRKSVSVWLIVFLMTIGVFLTRLLPYVAGGAALALLACTFIKTDAKWRACVLSVSGLLLIACLLAFGSRLFLRPLLRKDRG